LSQSRPFVNHAISYLFFLIKEREGIVMSAKKKGITKLVAKVSKPEGKPAPVTKVKAPVSKAKATVRKVKRQPAVEDTQSKSILAASMEANLTAADQKDNAEDRFNLIQQESYLLAEKDGFSKHPDYYWHAAEAKIELEADKKK